MLALLQTLCKGYADTTITMEPDLLYKKEIFKTKESFEEGDTIIYVGKFI